MSDNNIGAVLHINPDDSVISNKPTNYVLAFSDTTNRFKFSVCACTATVKQNTKTLSVSSLTATDELDSSNTFTFPEAGIYTLIIAGEPKSNHAFQAFKLDYTIRVIANNSKTQAMPIMLWIGIASMMGLVLLAAYAMGINYTDEILQ